MHATSISDKIADYTLNFSYDAIPKDVREYAKLLIADSLGVGMAAFHLEHAVSAREVARAFGSTGAATMWGTKEKSGMADAVLANAALIHGMDYDDTHVGGVVHPSASVVSTAFTVGEAVGADGKAMLEAIICGYEIIIRLALAARGGFHDRGFHATGILAPFAAACVAAKLLGLPKKTLVNALGICGSQTAALQEFLHDGTWTKKIHPGWGSHAAIYALMLAKGGLTGPYEVLEGGYGLYKSHIGTVEHVAPAFADLGQKWLTPEIAVKLSPVCHMIHSFSDCIYILMDKHGIKPDDIKEMECRIEKRCFHIVCSPDEAKKRPTTDYGMRFSLPYVAAMSVLTGRMSPKEIDEANMRDPKVLALIDKVRCVEDESKKNVGHFPGWVQITLNDGRSFVHDQRYERGAAQNPIQPGDILKKYKDNATINLSEANAERLMDAVMGLDSAPSLAGVLELLVVK